MSNKYLRVCKLQLRSNIIQIVHCLEKLFISLVTSRGLDSSRLAIIRD